MDTPSELALTAHSRASGVQFLAFFGVMWIVGSLVLPTSGADSHGFQLNLAALAFGVALATVAYLRARRIKQATRALAMSPRNATLRAQRSRTLHSN
jgi:purine-cytosine permease-like protein